jgi:hypothetical protein
MKRLHINEISRPLHLGSKIVRPPCIININNDTELKQYLLTLKAYNIRNFHVDESEDIAGDFVTPNYKDDNSSRVKDEVVMEELDAPLTTLEKLMKS